MSETTFDGTLIRETSFETLRSEDSLAQRVDAFGAENPTYFENLPFAAFRRVWMANWRESFVNANAGSSFVTHGAIHVPSHGIRLLTAKHHGPNLVEGAFLGMRPHASRFSLANDVMPAALPLCLLFND